MSFASKQREYLRAPYKFKILSVYGDQTYLCHGHNLSEGGILLQSEFHFPESSEVHMMLKVPEYVDIKSLSIEEMKNARNFPLEASVLRLKVQILRVSSIVDFNQKLLRFGARFMNLDEAQKMLISLYVNQFVSNMVYLLSLFEQNGKRQDLTEAITSVSTYFGFTEKENLTRLRQQILHAYHSLDKL